MKYALLSDIHANLEALQAVLSEISSRGITDFICLGDIVGYGADPRACLETVRGLNPRIVQGNHDYAAAGPVDLSSFNKNARLALLWTRKQLDSAGRDFLKSLPLTAEVFGATLVHSSLKDPGRWEYILNPRDARASFDLLLNEICFFGHSHRPRVYREEEGEITVEEGGRIELRAGSRYLINPGSVGQPRDRDPRASFGVYDSAEKKVEIMRIEYPVEKAQEKILRAGLPPFLASRLAVGR